MRSLSVYKMLLENMAWSVMLSQLPGLSQFSACHNTMCSEIHPTIHWLPTWGGGQRWGRGVGKWFIVKQGWSGIHFIYKILLENLGLEPRVSSITLIWWYVGCLVYNSMMAPSPLALDNHCWPTTHLHLPPPPPPPHCCYHCFVQVQFQIGQKPTF